MKNIKFLLLLLFVGALNGSCKEDEEPQKLTPPSGLTLNTEPTAGDPAEITVAFSAENTNFYRVWFGEDADEAPIETKEEMLTHTYTASGTYTITVQAHATGTVFITESKEVSIELDEDTGIDGDDDIDNDNIPETGYTTPESYEGMTLVWQDEFEGNALNTEDWTYEIGTGSNGWGNNELQYYREENTRVEDGYLVITAKKEAFEGQDYTSSRIITKGNQAFQYGRIDIRAVLPEGQGIWPALWMLGSNISSVGWPACGEIDIMEMIGGSGRDNQVHSTMHWDNSGQHAQYGNDYILDEGKFSDEFHVFSIVWDANTITSYVDDEQYSVIDISPEGLSEFQKEFFLIFNVAVGGNWPGNPDGSTTFPQQMIVDYVRVFQEQ